jgi:glutamate N-acetyltransferase/amino-acid N-acetyltransferase
MSSVDQSIIPVPLGFRFASCRAGFKYRDRDDLGIIWSQRACTAGGVFTRNRFQAAPVMVARQALESRHSFHGLVVNAGQANACTGETGLERCRASLGIVGRALGVDPEGFLPASTGVIGDQMDLSRWQGAVDDLDLSGPVQGPVDVARAMCTTDTFPKLAWRTVDAKSNRFRVLGMAKGAGMICPDMATMLCFIVCDAGLDRELWQRDLTSAVDSSFNLITVDGDTSTNDCVLGLASGMGGAVAGKEDRQALQAALKDVCQDLARLVVQDAEGGTKVVAIRVAGAGDDAQAEAAARCVAHSPLVKTALFGCDPNWGRIVAALGRSGAEFEPGEVTLSVGGRPIFQHGSPIPDSIDDLFSSFFKRQEVEISIVLGQGPGQCRILTSDLSLDYVRINASYRS